MKKLKILKDASLKIMPQTVILLDGIKHREGILQVTGGDKGDFPDRLAYSLIKGNLAEEIEETRGRKPKDHSSKQAKKEEKAEKNEEDSL